jgi:hypothetical protein
MQGLRWTFLLVCFGCVALVAWNGRWEGRLTRTNFTWIVDLGRAPIWLPPPEPTYGTFQKDFKESEGFPSEGTPGLTIKRVLKVDWMAVDLLLYLWPVSVIAGGLYLATRGTKRDLVLHIGLSAGIGLTGGALTCVGLWLLFGGWGPPAPEFFGGLGLAAGMLAGLVSYRESLEPADHG